MKTTEFFCPACNGVAFGVPALSLHLPDPVIDASMQGARISSSPDVCQILYPKPKRHFVRSNIGIPVGAGIKKLEYGCWIELSREDLRKFLNANQSRKPLEFHGYLANKIPGLEDSYGAPVLIHSKGKSLQSKFRPLPAIHSLYTDYSRGISHQEADLRVENWMRIVNSVPGAHHHPKSPKN